MDIADALRRASDNAGWSPARIAAEAGVTEAAARRWFHGAYPGGSALLALMRGLPGFAEHLGFREAA